MFGFVEKFFSFLLGTLNTIAYLDVLFSLLKFKFEKILFSNNWNSRNTIQNKLNTSMREALKLPKRNLSYRVWDLNAQCGCIW